MSTPILAASTQEASEFGLGACTQSTGTGCSTSQKGGSGRQAPALGAPQLGAKSVLNPKSYRPATIDYWRSRMPRPGALWLGLPATARQLAVFVAASALLLDLLLWALERTTPINSVTQSWEPLKQGVVVLGLALVTVRIRSGTLAAFTAAFAVIAFEDRAFLHKGIGDRLAEVLNLTALHELAPAPPGSWGQFLALSVLAAVAGGAAVLAILRARSPLRTIAMVLTGLLGLLFLFAGVVDLLADAYPTSLLVRVEEAGEAVALSLALGYTASLMLIAARGYRVTK